MATLSNLNLTGIAGNSAARTKGLAGSADALSQGDALDKLQDVLTNLTTVDGRRTRSGYVRVLNSRHNTNMTLENHGGWFMAFHGNRNRETATVLKALVAKAGINDEKLDAYLKSKIDGGAKLKVSTLQEHLQRALKSSGAPASRQGLIQAPPPQPVIPRAPAARSSQRVQAPADDPSHDVPPSHPPQHALQRGQGERRPPQASVDISDVTHLFDPISEASVSNRPSQLEVPIPPDDQSEVYAGDRQSLVDQGEFPDGRIAYHAEDWLDDRGNDELNEKFSERSSDRSSDRSSERSGRQPSVRVSERSSLHPSNPAPQEPSGSIGNEPLDLGALRQDRRNTQAYPALKKLDEDLPEFDGFSRSSSSQRSQRSPQATRAQSVGLEEVQLYNSDQVHDAQPAAWELVRARDETGDPAESPVSMGNLIASYTDRLRLRLENLAKAQDGYAEDADLPSYKANYALPLQEAREEAKASLKVLLEMKSLSSASVRWALESVDSDAAEFWQPALDKNALPLELLATLWKDSLSNEQENALWAEGSRQLLDAAAEKLQEAKWALDDFDAGADEAGTDAKVRLEQRKPFLSDVAASTKEKEHWETTQALTRNKGQGLTEAFNTFAQTYQRLVDAIAEPAIPWTAPERKPATKQAQAFQEPKAAALDLQKQELERAQAAAAANEARRRADEANTALKTVIGNQFADFKGLFTHDGYLRERARDPSNWSDVALQLRSQAKTDDLGDDAPYRNKYTDFADHFGNSLVDAAKRYLPDLPVDMRRDREKEVRDALGTLVGNLRKMTDVKQAQVDTSDPTGALKHLRDSRGGEKEKAFNGQPKSLDDIRLRAQFLKEGLLPHRQETQALHEKRLEKLELELKDVVAKRDERLTWQKSVKYEALTELREWAESRRGNGPVAQPAGSEQVPYETLEEALKELEARDAEMPSLVTLEDRVVELEQTIREEHASFERYEQRWEAGNTKLEGDLRLIGEMLNSSRMTSDRLSELEDKHLQALPKFW